MSPVWQNELKDPGMKTPPGIFFLHYIIAIREPQPIKIKFRVTAANINSYLENKAKKRTQKYFIDTSIYQLFLAGDRLL